MVHFIIKLVLLLIVVFFLGYIDVLDGTSAGFFTAGAFLAIFWKSVHDGDIKI